MSETLCVAALVRNEADRYLPSALQQWSDFADVVVVLDDGSDDGGATQDLCEQYPEVEYSIRRSDTAAWGNEAPARAELWTAALATGCDWILVLDADMVPARDPRDLLRPDYDAVSFNLYDLWEVDEGARNVRYRTDGHWKAHENWRCWMVRNPGQPPKKSDGWKWNERGVHCGHFPWNLNLGRTLYAPCDYGLLHYAYARPENREQKYLMYAETSDQMSEREIAHAESILQPAETASLPFTPEYHLVHEEDR